MVAPTPFFGDRGCHVRILEEARALTARDVQVRVVTYPVGHEVAGVTTVRTPRVPGLRRLPVGYSPHRLYLDPLLLGTTWRVARAFRPDVLHGHLHEGALIAWLVGRATGRPVVADLQGSLAAELADHGVWPSRGPLANLAARVEGLILRGPARLLASSSALARELVERWGLPTERVVCLPDGVDPEVFRPGLPTDRLRARLGLAGRPVVVFLGVLTPYQGVDDLLEAWPRVRARVPEAHLLLMGYPHVERYRAEVMRRSLGNSVTLPGRIPYAQAPQYLALGDVAVSPKRALTEANGKLLNYMAMGLATVAYESPVARELLGEPGVLVPRGDTRALAEACVRLLADPGERQRRGEALRERAVAAFGWPALAGRLLETYRALHGA